MNQKTKLISGIYKYFDVFNANHFSFLRNIIDESMTQVVVDKIPCKLNFFEKRKWLKHKENVLFDKKFFCRFFVKNYCVWLYSDKSASKWSVIEKVKSLKLVVGNITESEVWFLDDGINKTSFALFNGTLVYFKMLNEFSDGSLEHLIQHMKKYSFQSPKIRLFGSCFDFNYEVEMYSRSKIEVKTNTAIDNIKYKYIDNLMQNVKAGAINCFFVFASLTGSFVYNNKRNMLIIRQKDLHYKSSQLKKQTLDYPNIEHVKFLSKNVQRKINLLEFTAFIEKYDYKLKFSGKYKIELKIKGLNAIQKEEILNKGLDCGLVKVCFGSQNH